MAKNIDTILKIVPNLTIQEIEKVQACLAFFIDKTTKTKETDTEEVSFYMAMSYAIKRQTKACYYNFNRFKTSPLYKRFHEDFQHTVYPYVMEASTKQSKVSRIRMYNICCGTIIEYLKRGHISVNLTTTINNMSNIPGLMDQAFPGYARMGLLHKLTISAYPGGK